MLRSDPYDCWLGYRTGQETEHPAWRRARCAAVASRGGSEVLATARDELLRGLSGVLGVVPVVVPESSTEPHVLLAEPGSVVARGVLSHLPEAAAEASELCVVVDEEPAGGSGAGRTIITANTDAGCLHAVFAFLRRLQLEPGARDLSLVECTPNTLRMLDHWDNLDGTVERGYAGSSIFFRDGRVTTDLSRVRDYARLLASVGVNGVCINNVNVGQQAAALLTTDHLPDLASLARVLRRYGITLWLSVSFASPIMLATLPTADPLDTEVRSWWSDVAAEVYRWIPDLGGFVVKADSESRPGPHRYGRTQAEGANMLAAALRPFGGVVLWRAFVYDCNQDWRDRSTDRARAAYDTFMPLDGAFDDNVVVQVKHTPIDFQVREPISPLLGALRRTSLAVEVQVTQEYTGQQKDLCFLLPQWHEALSDTLQVQGSTVRIARVVSGQHDQRPLGGVVGVANVGDDPSWTGHVLAQANLYAFGRLAWELDVDPELVAWEWVGQTFGVAEPVASTVVGMLLASWSIYESYTAPLGVGWMITPGHHYGPDVDGYEYSRWGTYHFADRDGVGVDRTVDTGSGYSAQYDASRAPVYNDIARCPDELLLFFHHVSYQHRLHSGKTVIQHIYDSHFEGVTRVEWLAEQWSSLEGHVDPIRFREVNERFQCQLANARQWRDVIVTYFYRKSGAPDEQGRSIYA